MGPDPRHQHFQHFGRRIDLTERLYWTNPRALTALATVTGHVAGGFTLDRTIYHAPLACYHHAQPCDLGHILADGHKLKLTRVAWDRGRLIHRVSGPLPAVGAKAQLHLDAPRRERQARAHAALHLLVSAAAQQRATFVEPPALVGGGEARVFVKLRETPESGVPQLVARAQALADAREDVTTSWATREEATKRATTWPVPLENICPGEPTLRLVHCGAQSVLPCDAPLPARTWETGKLRLVFEQRRKEGVKIGVKVE